MSNEGLKLTDWFEWLIERLAPKLKLLWQARKMLLLVNGTVVVVSTAVLLLFGKPYFQSGIAILPEYGSKSSTLGGLSDLASLAGVSLGEASPTQIYAQIVLSESVWEPVIYGKYKTEAYADSVDLLQYFEIVRDEAIPEHLRERKRFLRLYAQFLKSRVTTSVEPMTRILKIEVTMPESQLSADVANSVVQSLDKYIRTTRKSYASNQRFYLEKRAAQLSDSLRAAENILAGFRNQNRVVTQSPQLLLELSRLTRTVDILQVVFVEVTKQLELAKIDEVRDAPVLNVQEYARDPVTKSGPARSLILIGITLLSFAISVSIVAGRPSFLSFQQIVKKAFIRSTTTAA